MNKTIAMFGEAERGEYCTAYFFQTVSQLAKYLGSPPSESKGIYCAVQALLYDYSLIYFKVKEEGFSKQDYFLGCQFLQQKQIIENITAIYLPGVGDNEIIHSITPICNMYDSILIIDEADLYDYVTLR